MNEGLPKEWMKEITGPRKILLVDDDENDREMMMRGSKEYNIEWYIAPNYKKAVECLEKHGKEFRLVFLDLNLNSVPDGTVLFRKIKEECPWLPVLVLSGHIDDHVIEHMTEVGFVMFLKKPIRYDTKFFGELFFAFNIPRREGQGAVTREGENI
jgi:DNA-binding NtrC family response regulator